MSLTIDFVLTVLAIFYTFYDKRKFKLSKYNKVDKEDRVDNERDFGCKWLLSLMEVVSQ